MSCPVQFRGAPLKRSSRGMLPDADVAIVVHKHKRSAAASRSRPSPSSCTPTA